MSTLDLLNHILNFVAPALTVGVSVALLAPIFIRKVAKVTGFIAQAAINSIASAVVLVVGLWIFGRDGKMATYGAMVLVCASAQWLGSKR